MGKTREHSEDANTRETSALYDASISQLFDSSLGPVKPVSITPARKVASEASSRPSNDADDPSTPGTDGNKALETTKIGVIHTNPAQPFIAPRSNLERSRRKKKKKRDRDEDDIEGMYMQRLDAEDSKRALGYEAGHVKKRQKTKTTGVGQDKSTSPASEPSKANVSDAERHDSPDAEVLQHESLTLSRQQQELEKSTRTVFLGNVSTSCIKSKTAKKVLLDHLMSFSHSLPASDKAHKIDSIRFRSTPFVSGAGPKKAAYAKKELMDTTTKSTNAYVVYTTALAAREAVKRLNGTTVLDRHLLVDSIAHPRKTDHRRCVFVGNLGFVDDDSQINAVKAEQGDQKPRKRKEPSDIEEGLWRQFSNAGSVESVRVVRDANTRVGKGFAYVQFENENAVEKALAYNEKKFPPMLPRLLRVTRAKKMTKSALTKSQPGRKVDDVTSSKGPYIPKMDSAAQSLSGRAGKLFGQAGAASLRGRKGVNGWSYGKAGSSTVKTPEQIVFEGYRASSKQGKGAKIGVLGKKQGKPGTRSSRRGAAFKAKGGKKVAKQYENLGLFQYALAARTHV
ncbi:MAG: hypothetical protein Q9213_000250 [Squamulea squamosa]